MASVTFHDQNLSLNRFPSSPTFRNPMAPCAQNAAAAACPRSSSSFDFEGGHDFASRISEPNRIPPLSLPLQFCARDSEQNKRSSPVAGGVLSPDTASGAYSNLSPTALKLLQNFYLLAMSGAREDDDEFRMYDFKVRLCRKAKNHDWTECPFAHPGERARRRDPRKYAYSGTACSEFRKAGSCPKGDACDFAHGVFECWLHPERYRTQGCKDGIYCNRKVCFFAHRPEELRVGSPAKNPVAPEFSFGQVPNADFDDTFPANLSLQASTSAGYSQSNPSFGQALNADFDATFPVNLSLQASTSAGYSQSDYPSFGQALNADFDATFPANLSLQASTSAGYSQSNPSFGQALNADFDATFPANLSLQASTSGGYSQSNPILPNSCRPCLQTLSSSPVHSTDFQSLPQRSAFSLASSTNGMSPEELDDLIAAAIKQLKLRELVAKAKLLSPTSYPFEPETQSSTPWENGYAAEPSLQRVESGRALRAEIYGKLSKELP